MSFWKFSKRSFSSFSALAVKGMISKNLNTLLPAGSQPEDDPPEYALTSKLSQLVPESKQRTWLSVLRWLSWAETKQLSTQMRMVALQISPAVLKSLNTVTYMYSYSAYLFRASISASWTFVWLDAPSKVTLNLRKTNASIQLTRQSRR